MTMRWSGNRSSSSASTLVSGSAAASPGTSGIVARVPILIATRSPVSTRVPPSFKQTSIVFGAMNRPAPMINSAPLALYRSRCSAISPSTISRLRANTFHVGADGTRDHSEPVCVVNQIGDFCAPDLVLAREAVGIRAGAADQFALDNGGAPPRFGHVPGEKLAACATAEYEEFIAFRFRHHPLRKR